MDTFVGRQQYFRLLSDLTRKNTASLVTIQGRRRIGKSTLVRRFCALENLPCFEFQGLPPRPALTNQNQLDEFTKTLTKYLNLGKMELDNWTQAFEQLNLLCARHSNGKKKILILLDEISWMGAKDLDFAGHLKDVWDRILSQNKNLILVICGSVSSWIQKNILDNTGFAGRISREFKLPELSIAESFLLLKHSLNKLTPREAAQIMSITGGVPKYLEEFSPYKSVTIGIDQLCFQPSGFLFNEFDALFSDTFAKRNELYRHILRELIAGPQSPQDLATKLSHPLNGDWSEHIFNLELAGFIRRDFTWSFKAASCKLSQLRVCDNYTKFYLKNIDPKKQKLSKLPPSMGGVPLNWDAVFGLQFENMMLNNLSTLVSLTQIPENEIVQLGPYFQTATKAKAGVQIDCLVQCKKGLLHLFEFKTGSKIGLEVEKEVARKTSDLKLPRGFSVRHYLVYLGELSDALQQSDFFDRKISFDEFTRN